MRGLLLGERNGVGVVTCPSVFMGPLRNTCGRMMRQGEGGDQRDAVVPALLTLGEHNAQLRRKSPAFLADIYAWSIADHTVSIFAHVRRELWVHSRVHIHSVNTQFWKRGSTQHNCQILSEEARRVDLCRVEERCIIVRDCCSCCARLHGQVVCCASSSDPVFFCGLASYRRVCVFSTCARDADSGCVIETWQACASGFRRPGVEELQSEAEWRAAWCRWADALAMIQQRHPAVATPLIGQATIQDTCWGPLNRANVWVMGSTGPEWSALVLGEHL